MTEFKPCAECALGLHQECLDVVYSNDITPVCCCGGVDWSLPFAEPAKAKAEREVMKPGDMKDPRSTGRKRAAEIAPIFTGMLCEWAYLKFAGGGVVPIIGCDGNLLEGDTKDGDGGDLHHGPDKNTLNNTPGVNLHRICKSCHHLWHKKNDPFYTNERPDGDVQWLPQVQWLKHDPDTQATDEELAMANATRQSINKKRPRELPFDDDLL